MCVHYYYVIITIKYIYTLYIRLLFFYFQMPPISVPKHRRPDIRRVLIPITRTATMTGPRTQSTPSRRFIPSHQVCYWSLCASAVLLYTFLTIHNNMAYYWHLVRSRWIDVRLTLWLCFIFSDVAPPPLPTTAPPIKSNNRETWTSDYRHSAGEFFSIVEWF